ncbi:class I SAM-dependent methyltransferase [Candidatus Pelagibacter sp.]|nr:class I SAM-dependent methyltransferase [Candidatus Pelagibacter sp.]
MKKKFLNLGRQPIANSFLASNSKKSLSREFFYNLSVSFDTKSFLVSVTNPVNPKIQYTDKYAHRASESKTMRNAFKNIAIKLKKRFKPKIVMEIGSNDGVFIKNFSRKKIIAVEPCKNLANITKKKFKTYPDFWTKKLANKIFKNSKKADIIFSANTISHIPDLKESFDAIELSLSKDGVLIIEDPALHSVIKNNSYDQFYDEHVYVFSSLAIANIVKLSGLRLFDVEKMSTHGGSMRYYICKDQSKYKNSKNLNIIFKEERKIGLNKFSTFKKFSKKVEKSKRDLVKLLKKLKLKNKKIISYGATYKSTTVFNYCKIGKVFLDYVTDTTLNKQGKFTPGQHIPIISPEKGMNESVDFVFLGAWNFQKEIMDKEKEFIKRGGKFITHVPVVKILQNK